MDSATDNCFELASALGLQPQSDGQFVGRIRGFPVGLKFINPSGAPLLLFEVRHWLNGNAPELQAIAYAPDIAKLMADKKIEIEFDDRTAWLTIVDLNSCLELGPVSQILDSVLETFQQLRLIGDSELCHYCRNEKVDAVTSIEGKVAQICAACLESRKQGREGTATAEAVPILLLSPFAAFAGALLWAAFWIGYTLVFESSHSQTLTVPVVVIAFLMVGVGGLVGGPVGWVIQQNRRRGRAVSKAAAIAFALLAVVAGEIFYVVWLIYHQFRVVSFSAALRVMPEYYLNNNIMYLADKFLAALFSVAFAEIIARPKAATLKL